MSRSYSVRVTSNLSDGTDFVIGDFEVYKSDSRAALMDRGLPTPAIIASCSDEKVWSAVVVLKSTAA